MMRLRSLIIGAFLFTAARAGYAQHAVFDLDDFVEPRLHKGPAFVSRLVFGGVRSFVDDYRPLHDDVTFIHVANDLYVSRVQFTYKHSEIRSETGTNVANVCGCTPPVYFPTPPPPDATPAAPHPGARDTVQFAWYPAERENSMRRLTFVRYRASLSRHPIVTVIRNFATGETVERRSGREQSVAIEADTRLHLRGRNWFGSLTYINADSSGTAADRRQQVLTYTQQFPTIVTKHLLFRTELTLGGVTHRGGTAFNVVNPSFEAYWHEPRTSANFHLVWSPQSTRSGNGWETHHQIAIFVDRALFVHLFGK